MMLRNIASRLAVAAVLLTAATATAAAQTVAKIHPDLHKQTSANERISVIVVLAEQPQTEIMRRIERDSWVDLHIAEADYQRLASLPFTAEEMLTAARSRVDAVTLQTRRQAAREIEAAIAFSQRQVSSRLTGMGATSVHPFRMINMIAADIPASAIGALESDADVVEVFPVEYHRAELAQSTATLGAPAYWGRGFTGAGQSVVVLDSGMRTSHPAFGGRLNSRVFLEYGRRSLCFDDNLDSPEDLHGHGSHVGGIVASQGSPDFSAFLGVARNLGTLYNFKVGFLAKNIAGQCSGGASVNGIDALDAIEWAVLNTPARIFNYSYGGETASDDSPLARLFDFIADTYRIVIVVAAGNEGPGPSTISSPANGYNIISVGNVDDRKTPNRSDDGVHISSSRGPTLEGRNKPDISAPGARIVSADFGTNSFVAKTGTSMAAPHVAGAVALIRQSGVTDALAVKALLINTTDQAGWNPDWGYGSVNLANTLARPNYINSDIPLLSVRYFRGSAPANLKATLVWNRHITINGSSMNSTFTDLNLYLYGRLNNTQVSRSDSSNQNVEQVFGRVGGEAVIKIKSSPGGTVALSQQEAFALALSEGGFVPAAGPDVALACSAPSNVAAGSSFTVECTATNRGELEAFGTNVEATLPAGFTGSRLQNFGVIPPSGAVARSFTFTASTAGSHRIAFGLSGSSFGEPYSASAAASVTVGASSGAILRLGTTALEFRYRLGGAIPAAQSVNISTGASSTFSVAIPVTARWLSAAPASGTAPGVLRVSVNPAGLAAGTYASVISVRVDGAANSPQNLPVVLVVEGTTNVQVVSRLAARSIPQGEPCTAPDSVTSFHSTDSQAYIWFLVNNAKAGDRATVTWHQPDGALYQSGSWIPVASDGNWCFSSSIDIAGHPPASLPGKWTAKVNWNGGELFTLEFTIAGVVNATDIRLAKSSDGCNTPEAAESFETFDPEVWVFFRVRDAKQGDSARNEWVSPDGKVFQSARWTPVAEDGHWCFRSRLAIEGQRAASMPGVWSVRVFWNETPVFTRTFRIVSLVEQRFTSATIPEERVCTSPPPATTFSPKDERALVWFSVRDAKAGDTPVAEWYSPDGELYSTVNWEPITWSGNGCLWAWIGVSGTPAAEKFGQWKVKVLWNGKNAFTLPFSVAPVRIERRLFTKALPAGSGCPTPEASDTFLTTDDRIYIWWLTLDAKAGDVAKVEWFDPSGRAYATSTWQPLARDGNFCFNGSLTLAGAAAAQRPGVWTVTVLWNGAPLFGASFTLATPDAPQDTRPMNVMEKF